MIKEPNKNVMACFKFKKKKYSSKMYFQVTVGKTDWIGLYQGEGPLQGESVMAPICSCPV